RSRPAERRVAVSILREYVADQPERLADLLADADAGSFALLLPAMQVHGERGIAALHAEWERQPAPGQANVALALLRLGKPDRVWPWWQHRPGRPDPSMRTYLIHWAALYGVPARLLVERLDVEPEVSARRALILSLGEYGPEQLPVETRQPLTE